MKHEFKRRTIELLARHRIKPIATTRPDRWPQAPIVGNAKHGQLNNCDNDHDVQKYANFIRDPRVSLAIANNYPQPLQIKGLSIAARAEVTTDPG